MRANESIEKLGTAKSVDASKDRMKFTRQTAVQLNAEEKEGEHVPLFTCISVANKHLTRGLFH